MKIAVQLFEHGASLDSKDNGGSGCLHWAVDGNKPDCIQWLLDKGIQVKEKWILCLKVGVYTDIAVDNLIAHGPMYRLICQPKFGFRMK